MSKDTKTLSNLRQALLDIGVNLEINTTRQDTLNNITFGIEDFDIAANKTFTLKEEGKSKAIIIMRLYIESLMRYKFFYYLETLIKVIAQKTIHRDKYEEAIKQVAELRDIVMAEAAVIEKTQTFVGTLVDNSFFSVIRNAIDPYFSQTLDEVVIRGSAETMLKRYILRCSTLLHYLQWVNDPNAFGEPAVGDDVPLLAYNRCEKIAKEFNTILKDFTKFVPILYDVIEDVSDERDIPTNDNKFILTNGFVLCVGTGKPYPVHSCVKTVYNTYLSKEYRVTEEFMVKWRICDFTEGHPYALKEDCVAVYDNRNRVVGNIYNKTAEKMTKKFFLNKDNGRLYNFDVNTYCCFVMGKGWYDKKTAEGYGTFEPALGMYIAKDGNFNILDHNADVLEYMEGFKHLPYEEVTRGSKNLQENTLFMGIELEVEMSKLAQMTRNQAARATLVNMKGHCIVVHDGSLENGYEIVSVPCTLNYHYELWKDLLRSQLRRQIVSYKRKSCGIHIHMSKESFTPLALGKFMTFITHPKNNEFIDAIAQRKGNDYNLRRETKIANVRNKKTLSGEHMGHYYAVNLDKPHTIEVRIFKGTLHYPSVMKNFEFCHALHSWVSSLECGVNDVENWKLFADYVKRNRKTYSFLYDFLKNHKGEWIKDEFRDISETNTNDVTDEHTETGTNEELVKAPIPAEKVALIRKATTAVRKRIINN